MIPIDWWLVPAWLDLELRRYLAACDTEEGVNMSKDNRTYEQKLQDRHGVPTRADQGRQRDAQKQGEAGKPKR